MSDLYNQIREQENKRMSALAAEQARRDAETRSAREIAEADAALNSLYAQERQEQLNAAVAGNERLIHEVQAAADILIEQLDHVVSLITSVAGPADALQNAINWQRNSMEQAVANYAAGWNTKAHIAALNSPDALTSVRAREESDFDINRAKSRFTKPLSRNDLLGQWHNAAPNPVEKQKRAGVILALFGVVLR